MRRSRGETGETGREEKQVNAPAGRGLFLCMAANSSVE